MGVEDHRYKTRTIYPERRDQLGTDYLFDRLGYPITLFPSLGRLVESGDSPVVQWGFVVWESVQLKWSRIPEVPLRVEPKSYRLTEGTSLLPTSRPRGLVTSASTTVPDAPVLSVQGGSL